MRRIRLFNPEVAERKKKLKEFFNILSIPISLTIIGNVFMGMAKKVFSGASASAQAGADFRFGTFSFLLMCIMVYLWGRPAFIYPSKPDEALKEKIRSRISNIHRDGVLMLLIVHAVNMLPALLSPGLLTTARLVSVGITFIVQVALLIVYVDSHLATQKTLMGSLYSGEELFRLRPGFAIPVYIKLFAMVFGFAILPFLLIFAASFNRVPWETLSMDLVLMLLLSSAFLSYGINSVYYGVQKPLDGLIAKMRLVAAGGYPRTRIFFSDEVAQLKSGFNGMVEGLKEREERLGEAAREKARLERELAVAQATADLAAQVSHDIRSPLAALGAAAGSLSLSEEQRLMVKNSVGRIQGIADDLLSRYRTPASASPAAVRRPCELSGLIAQVVEEKRLQHKEKTAVFMEFSGRAGLKASVDQREFQRIVSNLLNNAVEALEDGGTVSVVLSAADGGVILSVKDNGKGIPPEILSKLGRKGGTHDKDGGTGLGLYHARVGVEAWGGSLKIDSGPGGGTVVTIRLPAASAPVAVPRAVLLDDDPLVHMNWKMAAAAAGADLRLYKNPQELLASAEVLPRDIPLYIDSELSDDVSGEDVAKELRDKGFTDITMATGHDAAGFSHLPWLKTAGKEPPWA